MARPRLGQKPLRQISVATSLEAEEAVVELLVRVFNRPAAVYTNEKTKVTIASVYCPKSSDWNPARRAALRRGLAVIKESGLNIGIGKIVVRRVPREDWAESWKRHFKPISIGSQLLVRPTWIKSHDHKHRAVVVLDPGLSFGTGNHPTTSFCLQQIVRRRVPGKSQSFWDIGTGSGILSIAAAKLGYTPIHAIDFDPQAVSVARQNAGLNRVSRQIRVTRADITTLSASNRNKYDLIFANLISNLLLAEKRRLCRHLNPGGFLVLAGILKEEFPAVCKAYESMGLRLVAGRTEGEWRSGTFQNPP
jgi:ribosomal protein L11 methyltransferase